MKIAGTLLACTALLALAPAPALGQDKLGRLFLTPQQREELDRRRQANIQEAAVVADSFVTINGQVSRSSGKSTTWINGVPQESARKPQDPARVTLPGAEGAPSVNLKIGQTLDKVRGGVTDGLERGTIAVQPAGKR